MFQMSSIIGCICHGGGICFCTTWITSWLSPSTSSFQCPACNAVLMPSLKAVASATRIGALSKNRVSGVIKPPCQLRRTNPTADLVPSKLSLMKPPWGSFQPMWWRWSGWWRMIGGEWDCVEKEPVKEVVRNFHSANGVWPAIVFPHLKELHS